MWDELYTGLYTYYQYTYSDSSFLEWVEWDNIYPWYSVRIRNDFFKKKVKYLDVNYVPTR